MKTTDLNALSDDELDALLRDGQALKGQREKAKKQKAIEDAKATLAAAGLTFRDVVTHGSPDGKKRGRPPGSKTKTAPKETKS